MKRFLLACLAAAAVWPAAFHAQTPALPALTQPVNDLAGVIDADSAAEMDRQIRALQAATGDAVVVAAVPTFAPYGSIEEYAVRLYERAGIGVKGKDNGVLILVAVNDRKARIEVGYGLEGFLTDGWCGDVIRGAMLPAFRRGAFGEGLAGATSRVVARIADERGVTLADLPAPRRPRGNDISVGISIGKLIILIVIVLIVLSRGGGGGLFGFILGQAVGSAMRGNRRGRWNGGGFGGGGFGGGGFGGGFGGFGGGRSGGGGASGGW